MAHVRLRKFNTSTVYEGGGIANDMSMVVRAGNLIFLRGQTGFTLDNKFVGKGDAAAQADQAMKNVKVLLEEAGAKLEHICKITTYITHPAYRSEAAEARDEVFPAAPYPPSTLVVVAALAEPQFLVEIEAVAVLD